MCCSKKISKLLLFVFNIAFFILGAGVMALGIFLIVDKSFLLSVIGKIPTSDVFDTQAVLNTTSFLENGAYILTAAGAFIFLIAFCGLCGGIRESKCLLAIYAGLVMLILGVEIAAAVLYIFYQTDVENQLLLWLGTLIADFYYGATLESNNLPVLSVDSTGVSEAIDYVQVAFQCCGASNYTDYDSALNWAAEYNVTGVDGNVTTYSNVVVPVTCCQVVDPTAWPASLDTLQFVDLEACLTTASDASTNTNSCYAEVKSLLSTYSTAAIGVGVGTAAVQLFGIIAACCLMKIKNKESNQVKLV